MSSFVRTVLGDVPSDRLGICYAREHVIIDPSYATEQDASFLLDDVNRAAVELRACHAVACRAMVDTMPTGCGRNAEKLAAVSRASGVHLICPTGMHRAKYYRPGHRMLTLGRDGLAEQFIREITTAIEDEAPTTEPFRAGVIKVASGRDRLSPLERDAFMAAAIAHRATGCPIITHSEAGTAAMKHVDVFADAGVDLSRVTLSHTDRMPDVALHRALLSRGVRLEYDSCFRWRAGDGNPSRQLLVELHRDFPDQLMLGMDAARRSYWSSYGGQPGLTFLLTAFMQQMPEAGIGEEAIHRMFVTTPAAAFSFGSPLS